MGRKILLINIILLVAIFALAAELYSGWSRFQQSRNLPDELSRLKPRRVTKLQLPTSEEPAALPQYLVIADKNLFVPERSSAGDDEGADAVQRPELVDPKLHGVAVLNNERQAYLTEFRNRGDRIGVQRVVRVGDEVQGYTVTEISNDSITLDWHGQSQVIHVDYSAPSKKAPATQAKSAVTILRIGSPPTAVDTSATEKEAEDQHRGVEVSVVQGRQASQAGVGASRGATALGNRNGQRGVSQTLGRRGTLRQNTLSNIGGVARRPNNTGTVGSRPPQE